MISVLYKMEEKVIVIIHIYGAIAIFLLFFDDQDTESESWEMEIGVDVPIVTHTKSSKALWDKYVHTLQNGWKRLW